MKEIINFGDLSSNCSDCGHLSSMKAQIIKKSITKRIFVRVTLIDRHKYSLVEKLFKTNHLTINSKTNLTIIFFTI